VRYSDPDINALFAEQQAHELSVGKPVVGTLPNDDEIQRWDDVKPLIT